MQRTLIRAITIAALLALPRFGFGQDENITNRLTFSARFGFNISAKFQNFVPPAPIRTTPDGTRYNYDDGYVLMDQSGNFGGQTWNWGYDDRSSQVSGNNILLSRSTQQPGSSSMNSDPSFGMELAYHRMLGMSGKFRYGIEGAVNYLNISMSETTTYTPTLSRLTDAYPFAPGTTPPDATPAKSYQGSYVGPGFTIGDTPASSTTVLVPGALVTDSKRFDSDIWGFRAGPYLEMPIGEKFEASISAGFALGLLNNDISWSQTSGGVTTSASGKDDDTLFGFYAGANFRWIFSEHWNAALGVQFQDLGKYHHSIGGREIELDMSSSVFLLFGVSYSW